MHSICVSYGVHACLWVAERRRKPCPAMRASRLSVPLLSLSLSLLLLVVLATVCAASSTPKLEEWLQENNIDIRGAKVAEFPGFGAGMRATKDIKEGSLLASIPVATFFTSRAAREDYLKALVEEYPEVNDQLLLALIIHVEKHKTDSKFKTWLDSLPSKFTTSLYFAEPDLEELKGSSLLALTRSRLTQMEKTYDTISKFLFEKLPDLFAPETFTFEAFKWAVSTVGARSFTLNLADGPLIAMIPGLDAFNYGDVASEFKFNNETNAFEVRAGADIEKDDQILVNTGRKYNLDLLLSNGYIHDSESMDVVLMSTRMDEKDKDRELKLAILASKKLAADGFFYLTRDKVSEALLTSLRIQLAEGEDLVVLARNTTSGPISLKNELQVYRTILAACETMFREYQTTVDEDRAKLKKNLPQSTRNAIRLRLGEKEVLQATVSNIVALWRDFLVYDFPPIRPEDKTASTEGEQSSSASQKDEL